MAVSGYGTYRKAFCILHKHSPLSQSASSGSTVSFTMPQHFMENEIERTKSVIFTLFSCVGFPNIHLCLIPSSLFTDIESYHTSQTGLKV